MIIAFSGASHSGKTSAMNILKELDSEKVVLFNEVARENHIEIENIDELRKDAAKYLDFEQNIIQWKIDQETKLFKDNDPDKIYILDRSLADSLFYYTFYTDKNQLNKAQLSSYYEFLEYLFKIANEFLHKLDFIFLFKPIDNLVRKDIYTSNFLNYSQNIEDRFIKMLTYDILFDKLSTVKYIDMRANGIDIIKSVLFISAI